MPFARVGETNLYYRQRSNGPQPIVFVHGFCQSSVFWQPTLDQLPAGYQGMALDLKGFGDSDKPEGPYTIPVLADEIRQFLDVLGLDRVVLAGNSMGGVVCQSFATRHADRLDKLVLVSTGPYNRDPAGAQAKAAHVAEAELTRADFEAQVAGFFASPATWPANFGELVEVAARASRRAMAQSTLSSASLDFRQALSSVKVPTLIVQGELDKGRTPEDGRLMHEAIEGSILHILPGAAHTPMLERPELFHPILFDFLAG